tara:strand:- start:597 stop:1373 length:777 start_codon:yes stop_codon:yes gene_type:complete
MNISVVSGGFDPIHSGHLLYLKDASKEGDKLIVCLNSDDWLIKKKGNFFMPFKERKLILESLVFVDEVIDFEDDNKGSCINGLLKLKEKYNKDNIIFCNGGDRISDNIPELEVSNITFKYGVGGNFKKNSSSDILNRWSDNLVKRRWGDYKILFEETEIKVKELNVNPKSGMSFQKHDFRNELWFVHEGQCKVYFSKSDPSIKEDIVLKKNDHFFVDLNTWHQITNPYEEKCRIIEIQYGKKVIEEDIKRMSYYMDEN